MADHERRKTVIGDSYKGALEKKGVDKLRAQAAALDEERLKKVRVAKAKKEVYLTRHQKKIGAKKAEIAQYEKELAKAQKTLEENLYGMAAKAALFIFGIMAIIGVATLIRDAQSTAIGIFLAALGVLFVSICCQTTMLEAEKKVTELTRKLSIVRQELEDLKIPPS